MLRWLSCKFLLVTMVAFCFLALMLPNIGFAQGKSQSKKVLISFRQIPGPNERALVRAAGGVIKYSYHLVPGIAATVPQAAIDGLSHNPNVTMIEDDLTVYAVDAELDSAWGVEHIGAGIVHDSGNRGTGVKVAIIDSGIDYTHSDLDAHFVGSNRGYDFVNGDNDPMDDHGHGTHCAGILAAEDDGSGVVGVAPEADIYALKVLGANGSGSYSNVIAALQWAVDHGIQVTSNSYGSSGYPGDSVRDAFNNAAAEGVINVCAAGNSGAGEDTVIYPAKFASCIAVAATTSSDARASFSSTGPDVEIAAPGSSILSTYLNNGYAYMSGTSMACPHVSGVVALMIHANIADIRAKLAATAEDLGTLGWDPQYGNGLVNAVEAVGESSGSTNNPPIANDQSVETDEDISLAVELTASDQDNDTLTYDIISGPSHGNLSGTAPNVLYTPDNNYNGLDSFTFKVNDGNSDSGPATVSINVITVNDPPFAYAGSNQSVLVGDIVHFDGSASDDPDGYDDIVSFTWDFDGDGTQDGSGETPTHEYAATGTYTVVLTVEDNDGAIDTDEVIITVNEADVPETIHVDSIAVTTINVGKGQKSGYALVRIVNNLGNPVGGVTVTGEFQDDINEGATSSDKTNSSGMIEFFTDNTAKGRCHITFCVNGVDHSTLGYNADDNIEVCGSNY